MTPTKKIIIKRKCIKCNGITPHRIFWINKFQTKIKIQCLDCKSFNRKYFRVEDFKELKRSLTNEKN